MSREEIKSKALAASNKVNIVPDGSAPGRFKITLGIFHSFIGWQTCEAAKIKAASGLTHADAIKTAAILKAWLGKQGSDGR